MGLTIYLSSQGWSPIWLEPGQALYVLLWSLWAHTCMRPIGTGEHAFLGVTQHLLFDVDSWASRGKDEDIPCRAKCCEASCSLRMVWLWSFVSVTIHWRRILSERLHFYLNSKQWELQFLNILLCGFKTNGKLIATRVRLHSALCTSRLRLGVLINVLYKGPAGR